MKPSDAKNPKLDQKWWSKHKPRSLKATGFGKAIAAYQAAKDSTRKDNEPKAIVEMKKKLQQLAAVRAKAENMAAKDAGKHKETLEALKNYQKMITKEDQLVAALVKEHGSRDQVHKGVLKVFAKLTQHCEGVTKDLFDLKKEQDQGATNFSENEFLSLAFKQLGSLGDVIKKVGAPALKKWHAELGSDATKTQAAEFKKCQSDLRAMAKWPAEARKSLKTGGNMPPPPELK